MAQNYNTEKNRMLDQQQAQAQRYMAHGMNQTQAMNAAKNTLQAALNQEKREAQTSQIAPAGQAQAAPAQYNQVAEAAKSAGNPAATGAYTGLQGVSGNTAQQLGNYQKGYTPSAEVQQAQQALQNVLAQKPQGYESKYGAQLDSIMQQITNPEKFKYSFNGDELFKNYADVYTQKGKQASLDAMGQAAALTGGYGNSYGQQVGNQAYQQYLMDLYDKGLDLYDRAYQRYQDEQAGLYNQLGAVQGMDEMNYGRYRDTVGDWQGDRDYYTGQYNTLSDRDYGRYGDQRDYWTGMAQAENADHWTGQNFTEGQRQFDEGMAENQRQFDASLDMEKMTTEQKYAADYAMQILANGQMPSEELLQQAGLSKPDAKKLMAKLTPAGSGSGKKGKTGSKAYVKIGDKYFELDENGLLVNSKDNKGLTRDQLPKGAQIDPGLSKGIADTTQGAADITQTAIDQVMGSKPVQAVTGMVSDLAGGLTNFFTNPNHTVNTKITDKKNKTSSSTSTKKGSD